MRIKRDHLILALPIAVLIAVFVAGLWFPHRRALAARQEQVRVRQEQITAERAKTTSSSPPTMDHSDSDLSEAQLELAIPARPELGLLLSQMGEDLNTISVIDQQLQAKAIVDGSDFSRIPMTLHFQGSFNALFSFLQRLESRQRIIRIDRVVVRQDRGGGLETLRVDIDLSTFFRASEGNT